MDRRETAALVAASILLGLGAYAAVDRFSPRPILESPDGQKAGTEQDCPSLSDLLENYLLEGFKSSTGFDWMGDRGIETKDIKLVTACSSKIFQGSVVTTRGVNVRIIPHPDNNFVREGLKYGEQVTFDHVIFIKVSRGEEKWGARIKQVANGESFYDFFMIMASDGTELVRIKVLGNQSNYPKASIPGRNGRPDLISHAGSANTQYTNQPPNTRIVRAGGGRVFIA